MTDAMENRLMLLLFNNTNFADVGDATGLRGSTVAGSFFLSAHTADPAEAGTQTTSEVTYSSYGRVTVARSGSGFTVTANSISPTAVVTFPTGTGGSGTITHFGIGTASSGAGVLLWRGTVTPNIVTGNGITPSYTVASAVTVD